MKSSCSSDYLNAEHLPPSAWARGLAAAPVRAGARGEAIAAGCRLRAGGPWLTGDGRASIRCFTACDRHFGAFFLIFVKETEWLRQSSAWFFVCLFLLVVLYLFDYFSFS